LDLGLFVPAERGAFYLEVIGVAGGIAARVSAIHATDAILVALSRGDEDRVVRRRF
jgi:hypothetical protein